MQSHILRNDASIEGPGFSKISRGGKNAFEILTLSPRTSRGQRPVCRRRVPHHSRFLRIEWVTASDTSERFRPGRRLICIWPLLSSPAPDRVRLVGSKATPPPVSGLVDQSALDRVRCMERRFSIRLDSLVTDRNQETVLPNRVGGHQRWSWSRRSARGPETAVVQKLFDHFQYDRGVADLRFGDEQMEMWA